jgi:phosphonate transport system permease protein
MVRTRQQKAVKPPLFDRIFKPKVIMIGDHCVSKPRSRAFLIWLVMIALVWGSVLITGFDLSIIIKRGYQFTVILKKVFNPDWSYFGKVITPLLDTIKMSVLGSVIGSTLALPFAVLASANINRSGALVAVLRVLLNIVRTLPTLVIASVCTLVFGLGTFAGTVAITVFTFGIVSKMLYESIETIDMGAFEAIEALGGSKFQAFWSACFPQILPTYLSQCLYSFEINVRAASILGYVGAGGLGILINERIGWRDYEGLGTVLIALFAVVLIIENTSQYLRRKLS